MTHPIRASQSSKHDGAPPPLLRAVLTRSSVAPKTLIAPGPTRDEMQLLVAAALTAPDHESLRPWRLVSIEGDGRDQLARTFMTIRRLRDPKIRDEELNRTWRKAMRGPTLVAVVGRFVSGHPKVPLHEQYVAVGGAVHALMLACHALGYGAIMLSGNRARHGFVHRLLGLEPTDHVIGFISIGTPAKAVSPKTRTVPADVLRVWSGDAPTAG